MPAGEAALALARSWRATLGQSTSLKQTPGVKTGHVRLAAIDSLVNHVIPVFVATLTERNAPVSLVIEVTNPAAAADAIAPGAADVATFNLRRDRD